MRRFGRLAATTVALTAVLAIVFGALLIPRSVAWVIRTLTPASSVTASDATIDDSEEGRQRQMDLLWDYYREVRALVQISDHDRDTASDALQAIASGEGTQPGLYLQLKESERAQNRAANRIRELPAIPQARQARNDLYGGFRARADAAGHFAEYLRTQKLDELWTGKLDLERGDGIIAYSMEALVAIGHSIGIDLTTGQIER